MEKDATIISDWKKMQAVIMWVLFSRNVRVRELLDKDIGSIKDAPFKYSSLFCHGGSSTSFRQVNLWVSDGWWECMASKHLVQYACFWGVGCLQLEWRPNGRKIVVMVLTKRSRLLNYFFSILHFFVKTATIVVIFTWSFVYAN
jgi:hypothetical protein